MKNRSGSTSNQGGGISASSSKATSPAGSPKQAPTKTRLFERLLADEAEDQRKRAFEAKRLRAEAQTAHREGLDFDEIFDDDDGGWEGEEEAGKANGQDEEALGKKSNYRLSSEGRLVKRIVKHLDKDNDIIYASDEEDEDEDEDDLGFEDLKETAEPPRPSASQAASSASRINTPQVSRATSPAASPQKPASSTTSNKKAKSTIAPTTIIANENQITEAELVGYLRQGPLSTKELIAKFKRQLKADAKNKEIFRDLVRKVAMVKASATTTGEEDKLLELKPEYK